MIVSGPGEGERFVRENRTLTINDGTPLVDVSIEAPIFGAGGLTKAGAGTLQLAGNNTYTGGTTLTTGTVMITKDSNLGTAAPLHPVPQTIILWMSEPAG